GPNLRGIDAASRYYLDKPARSLDLAEAALLVAIPRGPTLYDPARGTRAVRLRRDRVLFFVDHMAAGMYHYRYLARATTLGKFVLPSTRVEEMYTPETFGRNGASLVSVQ
ncbi:MAG TPA: transglycosylase domain-containing protein, partial [Polyangiaceae bacterium]